MKPKLNDLCIVTYDGRRVKATVERVTDKGFDVVTSFGADMFNIPFAAFQPYYILLVDPKELLTMFWQRTSDACPLEATEMENQENEWRDWIGLLENNLAKEKEAPVYHVVAEKPKWWGCKNCDCGEMPKRRCDCSCHD